MLTIEQIRALIQAGQYIAAKHLVDEFNKDGLDPEHATLIILNRKVIAEYPERE